MIKAVFFDVDGTLLSPKDSSFPDSARQALCQLKAKGIKIFLATGRHLLEMEELEIMDLSFDGYVLLNGQLCLDKDMNILSSFPIKEEASKTLARLFEAKKVPLVFVEKDKLYINMSNKDVKRAQKTIALPIPPIEAYKGDVLYQATAFASAKECENIIAKLPHCKMMRWNDYAVDIISDEGGKAIGIAEIIKHYHLQREEIMAFGDNENDIDMLEFAGIGIAMGNAKDVVKQAGDDVTNTVDEDGIYHALRKYKLI